jgi:hypothetical protein
MSMIEGQSAKLFWWAVSPCASPVPKPIVITHDATLHAHALYHCTLIRHPTRRLHTIDISTLTGRANMPRLRSGGNAPAPTPARTDATRRPVLREKTNITGTPAAVETSMLALKNFKRRSRQGSMLEMVRQRRSSVAQSLMNVQPQDDDVEDTSVFDLGSASEGEDDFAPEAEGTPIQTSKTRKSTSTRKSASARKSVAPTPSVRKSKRKSDDLGSPHSALDALRKKHRKSEVSHVEDEPLPSIDDEEQPAEHGMSEHEPSPVPEPVTSDVQVLNSSPESTPPTEPSSTRKASNIEEADFAVPSTEEQARADAAHEIAQEDSEDPEDDLDTPNATMAEPASSSPIGSPIPETQSTDIYADPVTQDSPPPSPEPAKTRGKGAQKKPVAMSTATLLALLPRRTQRATQRPKRTEYEISSDEGEEGAGFDTTNLDEDEDELGGRMKRQTRKAAPAKGKKTAAASAANTSKAKTNPKQQKPSTKAAISTRKKSKAHPPSASTGNAKGKGKTTRTYGRASAAAATTSDKENENQPSSEAEEEEANTSLSMREVAHSKELEEARRKFAEVDNWDLAFESMSNEDHRSSSQNWR